MVSLPAMRRDPRAATRFLKLLRYVSILVAATIFLSARPANACGQWSLDDAELGTVVFLLHNVHLRGRLIYSLWGTSSRMRAIDSGGKQINSPRGYKTVFELRRRQLEHRDKRIGQLKGATLSLGQDAYRIRVGADWSAKVVLRGKTIARTKRAAALFEMCDGGKDTLL
jgi:hypothetical protein